MEKKLMWFFSLWLTLMIATITVQYLYTGSLNLAYLLGTTLGTAIVGWLFISGPRRRWIYWAGMVSWVLIVPSGFIVLIRFIASLLSVKINTAGYIAIYLLGALANVFIFIRTHRAGIEEIYNRPQVDERYQYHFGLSSFWSFIFLNLLIIGALLQPWVSLGQIGLWIGVLIAGLVFWITNLLILEWKR